MARDISDLIEPIRQYQIGDGVPWNEWEASLMGAASVFRSYDIASAADRALKSYASIYTRVEDRDYTKSELVTYLYKVCERYDVDRVVAYNQIMTESAFNPKAVGAFCVLGVMNKKCALGIAQFIPATARAYGLQVDAAEDGRLDAMRSLDAYGAYMRDLLNQFGKDYLKALAAYNAGPGAVQKSVERNGEGWLSGMPAETQAYIVKILGERAISDPAVLQSIQQSGEKAQTTQIGWLDLLTSDLGPDIIKRWALILVGIMILGLALLPQVLKIYQRYKP